MDEQPFVPQDMQSEAAEPAETGTERMTMNGSLALGAAAQQDMTMNASLALGAAAGRDMTAADSVSITTAVGRDLRLTDSVAGLMVVGNSAQFENGGAGIALCREVTAQNGSFGVVVAQQANLAEGSKVSLLVGWKHALIFGAAFGAVFALLGRLLRRK